MGPKAQTEALDAEVELQKVGKVDVWYLIVYIIARYGKF